MCSSTLAGIEESFTSPATNLLFEGFRVTEDVFLLLITVDLVLLVSDDEDVFRFAPTVATSSFSSLMFPVLVLPKLELLPSSAFLVPDLLCLSFL